MFGINTCVMDVVTGKEKWISIPSETLEEDIGLCSLDDIVITDFDDIPFELGTDLFRANEALLACRDAGITDLCAIAAICEVIGCFYIDDEDFTVTVRDVGLNVFKVEHVWADMDAKEKAACFLATEKYVPFGNLKDSDLVLVEDKLSDFINWHDVWDDYNSKGFACAEINGTTYVVEC